MTATPKRKLCWNCDGSVPLAVDQCTYCGASVKEGAAPPQVKKATQTPAPPFAARSENKPSVAPQPPFDIVGRAQETGENEEDTDSDQASVESVSTTSTDSKSILSSLFLLLAGSVFFLFGLVLWLFSEEGIFTLHWNGEYWYVHLLGGILLLLLGWRAARYIDDNELLVHEK